MNLRNKSARQRPRLAAGADSGPAGAREAHFAPRLSLPIRAMPDIRSARIGAGIARAPAGFAAIAQSVEHVIRNDGVGGSNPSCGTSAQIIPSPQVSILTDASRPDGTTARLMSVRKLTELGWTAGIGLEEGLAATYRWYCDNRDHLRGLAAGGRQGP